MVPGAAPPVRHGHLDGGLDEGGGDRGGGRDSSGYPGGRRRGDGGGGRSCGLPAHAGLRGLLDGGLDGGPLHTLDRIAESQETKRLRKPMAAPIEKVSRALNPAH